ncbi:heme o synthase [Spirosoma utsteinense]|uniref:Protoheme IX farnesyltransferase n=1 Tax=Spirosoma utsteinense TaxID=2585773 RepID=A0ABR6W4N6_9BACT|nr:heme o synthase [Spirosoma utsteinense]MBC3785466.1 protoheme IX farnesyltransferase [Spirosoma utsteinense]MBC3791505.1 protoheme IX farnesyltransferase [Spirosoma utsteinense]
MDKVLGLAAINAKAKAYVELIKLKLTLAVVFSGVFGYCLAVNEVIWWKLAVLIIASIAITGSANTINQIIERESDKVMKRTASRPLPTGRLTVTEAALFAFCLFGISCYLFVEVFNIRAAALAVLSLLLYGFVYTPLKTKGQIAVWVGALPGAFPPMIGWVAATNHYGWEPGILFAIQFFWQFPHFWSIGWLAFDEYKKVGIQMMPGDSKNTDTAFRIMIYTLFLIPIGWLPYMLGMTGINSALVAMVGGILFLAQTFHLMRTCTDKAALQMMFGSLLYLPVVQIVYLIDKV